MHSIVLCVCVYTHIYIYIYIYTSMLIHVMKCNNILYSYTNLPNMISKEVSHSDCIQKQATSNTPPFTCFP